MGALIGIPKGVTVPKMPCDAFHLAWCWYEREHRGLGVPFPPVADEVEALARVGKAIVPPLAELDTGG